MDPSQMTLAAVSRELKAGDLQATEVVESIAQAARNRDKDVGGYLSMDVEAALTLAKKADPSLPLGGIPIAIKDVISVAGQPCSCASKMLEGYIAPYDAAVIERLKAAGGIPLGRTNMDEFAMGSSTENSGLQKTVNPWDHSRAPGGSSGGSAAVIASDTAIAALGSDTGGSIRQPAAFCGGVGMKPTYGRVSRYGLVAFASSLDQIGPMTKTVEDAALLMDVLAGPDERDSTCLERDVPCYAAELGKDLKGVKIGLPKEYFIEGTEKGVSDAIQAAVKEYESLGAEIEEVSLPHSEPAVAVYYIIAPAEASANLARFDGVRYGHRSTDSKGLIDHYETSRSQGFGDEVKRRIILGTYVLSSGYYDAYYTRAQKVRSLIRRDFEAAFEKVDLLLSPTCPSVAFPIGEKSDDPLTMYLSDLFTISANLAGICGISIPCGFSDGMPVGMQLLGPAFGEAKVFQAAHAYEQATEWHQKRPDSTLFDPS